MEKNSSNKRTKNNNQSNKTRKKVENGKNINNKKTGKNKKKIWPKVLLAIVIVLAVAGGAFAYNVQKNGGGAKGVLTTVLDTKKDVGEFQCLILGISTDEKGSLLTDTIMVASYNPKTQKAALISIPRDSYTGKNPAKATAYEKINSLYSRKEDPKTVLDAVNNLTGLDLKYYAIVKTEAFIKLVDAIGGVTFNVPIDMDYDDTSQDLHIHLKAGEQELDGDKAEQLVRFRHNNDNTSYPTEYGDNDLGRMRTQREFIMQVIKQTAKVENITKIGKILDIAGENVITNIDFEAAKDYIPYVVEFNTDNLETDSLPGTVPNVKQTNNVSIFVVDKVAAKEMVQSMFYDVDGVEEGNTTEETNTSSSSNVTSSNKTSKSNTTSSQTAENSKSNIKIEVLNGSGVSSNLQKVVDQLEGAGFKISRTGSTNSTAKTVIMNKKSTSDSILNSIKTTIGTGYVQDSESNSSKVNVVVIIGKDYE